jgi:hypothetical protein
MTAWTDELPVLEAGSMCVSFIFLHGHHPVHDEKDFSVVKNRPVCVRAPISLRKCSVLQTDSEKSETCFIYMIHSVCKSEVFKVYEILVCYALCMFPNITFVPDRCGQRDWWDMVHMGERRGAYKVLVGRPEGRRPLGRPRCRWKDNVKMGFQDGLGGMDWVDLAQDRDRWRGLVNVIMNLWVP